MDHTVRTWPSRLVARPWLLAFVPINAASAGFGVTLPLLILVSLHETWSAVAIAATLFNAAIIGASLFWGHVSERSRSRRNLLLINFGGFAILYALLAHTSTLSELLAIYTLIGFLAPAGANASNLLILEKFNTQERPGAFASFQEMSMVGAVVGLLVGYFWLAHSAPLALLLYGLSAMAFASALGVVFGVRDAPHRVSLSVVVTHRESFVTRLHHSVGLRTWLPFFPHLPRIRSGSWSRLRRWLREEAHHELPLIFAATLLFNFSANLFNVSYTPYLYSVGIGAASIFLVNVANNLAQTVAFPVSGSLTQREGPDRLVQQSTYVRSLGYLAVAGFTFVPFVVSVAFTANIIAFALMGAAIALYSTASSILLFRALEGRDAGRLIGFNSALGGLAAVGGALAAEVLSLFGSFRLVFLVSAVLLLASIPLWAAVKVAVDRRGRTTAIGVKQTEDRGDAPLAALEPG